MSHVATIELKVKSLDALAFAAERLGCELIRGQQTYRWYGRWVGDYSGDDAAYRTNDPSTFGKCDHAIRVKGNDRAYEVGVVANGDGSYRLLWDFFSGGCGLMERIGDGAARLKQAYGIEAAKAAARKQGLYVVEKPGEDGAVKLVMRKAGG